MHLDPAQAAHVPLPRSTWSDALAAGSRLAVLKETLTVLNAEASATLPDRLAGIPGLGARAVCISIKCKEAARLGLVRLFL